MHPTAPVILALLSPLFSAPTPGSDKLSQAPPGTVLIKSERVKVGLDPKDAEKMIAANEQLGATFASETPQHQVKVDDFYLMVTEVTNEQYAEFVKATGAQPPWAWGEAAIAEANLAFQKEQFEARQAAKAANQAAPERKLFDPQGWWARNWEEAEWEVPKDIADHPVCYVDYAGASNYARWAGMRLMTEYEYQAAVRGKTENIYPWGNDWDDKKYAHSAHYGTDKTLSVGSFPAGVSKDGIHDLAGSVWEWTSSPFRAFPKYKPIKVKVDGRTREPLPSFDGNKRVAVGGGYKVPKEALRATVRRGTGRTQSADGLGIRCAATTTPGADMAATILLDDVPSSRRPVDVDYDPANVTGIDRWQTRSGTAKVEGYNVITSYDAILFIPVEKAGGSDLGKLGEISKSDGVAHLGLVYTTQDLMLPKLPRGTYFVGYRAGTRQSQRASDEEAAVNLDVASVGADPTEDNLVYLTVSGDLVAAIPRRGLNAGKLSPSSMAEEQVRNAPNTKPEDRVEEMDVAVFTIPIPAGASRRGFMLELPFGMPIGSFDDSWRRP